MLTILKTSLLVIILSAFSLTIFAQSYIKNAPIWSRGGINNTYHIKASRYPGRWIAQPGYLFVNPMDQDDPRTQWTPGLRHPRYHIIAANTPGWFVALPGYKFVPGYGLRAQWRPNLSYADLKIISTEKKGVFRPFEGYKFKDPGNGLVVVPTDDDSTGISAALAVLEGALGGLIDYFFPGNPVSGFLYTQAMSNGLKVIIPKNMSL